MNRKFYPSHCIAGTLLAIAAASCQTTTDVTSSLEIISDQQLDKMEVSFSKFPLPPPQRSIEDIKKLVSEFDFSHKSACDGGEFYEVSLPIKLSSTVSSGRNNTPLAWRDAANTAFQYGDFETAMGYLDRAPTSNKYIRGAWRNIRYTKSIYLSILGDTSGSKDYFSSASGIFGGGDIDRGRAKAWAREAAAYNAYAQGRFREAEVRLRNLRNSWAITSRALLSNSPETVNLHYNDPIPRYFAITNDTLVNYLLILSLVNQNKLATAEAEARYNMWTVEDPIDLAWIMDALVVVMIRQAHYEDAEWVLQKLADFFDEHCAPSHYFIVLRTYLRLASVLVAQGKWKQALPYFNLTSFNLAYAEHDRDESSLLDRQLLESPDWPIAKMLSGDFADARETFKEMLPRLTEKYGADSYIAKEVAVFEALNNVISNQNQDSLLTLNDAITVLLEANPSVLGSNLDINARGHRMAMLVDKFLSLPSSAGGIERSFKIGQVGKHGTVQAALASSALRARVADPGLRSLLRKYQDINNRREEIDRIYASLLTFQTTGYKGPGMVQLDTEVRTLDAAKVTALDRLETEFPDFIRFIENRPLSVDEVRTLLKPDEAVVLMRAMPDFLYVWAVNQTGELSVVRADLSSAELKRLVDGVRHSVDPGPINTLGDIPKFDAEASYALYQNILEPVRKVWGGAKILLVVPDGVLQQIPFSLLVTSAPKERKKGTLYFEEYRNMDWLARTHSITSLPSLSSLAALRGFNTLTRTNTRKFVGFGDPLFTKPKKSFAEMTGSAPVLKVRSVTKVKINPVALRALPNTRSFRSASLSDLPPLPDTRDELLSIAKSIGVDADESVFLGADANEIQLFGMDLSNVKTLAFATHGLVAGDLDGLNEPALALSHPAVIGDKEGDGLLRLSEIIGLKLNADLVILSACNTASEDGSGAEAVSGLGRAFFLAGTKSLLVSHWPVHSKATTSLMSKTFENLSSDSTLGRAEAVRQARIQLIDKGTFNIDGKPLFSYAHPIFWAPFTLVGDGG